MSHRGAQILKLWRINRYIYYGILFLINIWACRSSTKLRFSKQLIRLSSNSIDTRKRTISSKSSSISIKWDANNPPTISKVRLHGTVAHLPQLPSEKQKRAALLPEWFSDECKNDDDSHRGSIAAHRKIDDHLAPPRSVTTLLAAARFNKNCIHGAAVNNVGIASERHLLGHRQPNGTRFRERTQILSLSSFCCTGSPNCQMLHVYMNMIRY